MTRSDWIILVQFCLNVLVITLFYWREWLRGHNGRQVVLALRSMANDQEERAKAQANTDAGAANCAIGSMAALRVAAGMVETELLDAKGPQ